MRTPVRRKEDSHHPRFSQEGPGLARAQRKQPDGGRRQAHGKDQEPLARQQAAALLDVKCPPPARGSKQELGGSKRLSKRKRRRHRTLLP